MPRSKRKISSTGIYHIILRGNQQHILFADEDDFLKFEELLQKGRENSAYLLFVYCLMDNHVHLLLQESKVSISSSLHSISSAYASYFNYRYQMSGHVFQDRFHSYPVEDRQYFLTCVRYICNNPVKAGLVDNPLDYYWLGCSGVTRETTRFPLDQFPDSLSLNGAELKHFALSPPAIQGNPGKARLSDSEVSKIIASTSKLASPLELSNLNEKDKVPVVKSAIAEGASIRQIARVTGISPSAISRLSQK